MGCSNRIVGTRFAGNQMAVSLESAKWPSVVTTGTPAIGTLRQSDRVPGVDVVAARRTSQPS